MKKPSRWVLSLFLILIIFLLPFLLFNLFYNRVFLPPALITTAEALLKSPTIPPEWIRLNPPAGSILHGGDSIEIGIHICTVGISDCKSPFRREADSSDKYRNWSIISINGGQYRGFLGGGSVGTMRGGMLTLEPYPLLLPGYHLFKIQPAGSQEEQNKLDPKLSYEWAYRIE